MKVYPTAQLCGDRMSQLKREAPEFVHLAYELASGGWVIGRFVRVKRKEAIGETFHLPVEIL